MENLNEKQAAQGQTLYKIGEASTRSGVPIETIRIWERRYNAVEPIRTVGRHRKYTDENVRYLAALKAMVDSGRRIGQVVKLSEEEALLEADRLNAAVHSGSSLESSSEEGKLSEAQCAAPAKATESDDSKASGHTPWQPRY